MTSSREAGLKLQKRKRKKRIASPILMYKSSYFHQNKSNRMYDKRYIDIIGIMQGYTCK